MLKGSDFHAFFYPRSEIKVPFTLSHPRQVAEFMLVHSLLNQQNGILIGNPIPSEGGTDESALLVSAAIEQALIQTEKESIRGKDVTLFILQRVSELTGGESLKANIALIQNNAVLAGKIASQFESVRKGNESEKRYPLRPSFIDDGKQAQTTRTPSTRTFSTRDTNSPRDRINTSQTKNSNNNLCVP